MKKFLIFLFFFSPLWANDLSWQLYKEDTLLKLTYIPGFCSQEKAGRLMDFIYEIKPKVCVEIGALGGSTTFPLARALSFLKQGSLAAIDAWENQAFLEGLDADDPTNIWWASLNIDMEALYQQLLFFLKLHNLTEYCTTVRARSETISPIFAHESIDMLYLDGNISKMGSLRDAELFFPKVKRGGYIWLNLADLETKSKTVAFLMKRCIWIRERSLSNHCLLFKKV